MKKPTQKETVNGTMPNGTEAAHALKRWRFLAVLWPLLCMVFMGIILFSPDRNIDERIADVMFTLIPLVFFAVGMSIRRSLLKERRYATVLTTATVVSEGLSTRPGKRSFFPEFEFQAGGKVYHVKSEKGSGVSCVTEGKQEALYYAPENPGIFYVPKLQKYQKRVSALLCGIGIIWPVVGLFAPQIRMLFSFLQES